MYGIVKQHILRGKKTYPISHFPFLWGPDRFLSIFLADQEANVGYWAMPPAHIEEEMIPTRTYIDPVHSGILFNVYRTRHYWQK